LKTLPGAKTSYKKGCVGDGGDVILTPERDCQQNLTRPKGKSELGTYLINYS